MSREIVVSQLEALGVPYEVVECDPDFADTANFCERYGYAMEASANAICVVGKSSDRPMACCIVLASTRLDVNGVVAKAEVLRQMEEYDAASAPARRPSPTPRRPSSAPA